MFFFGTVAMATMSLIMGPLLGLGFITHTGSSIVMMMVYVWSKEFPHQVHSFAPLVPAPKAAHSTGPGAQAARIQQDISCQGAVLACCGDSV